MRDEKQRGRERGAEREEEEKHDRIKRERRREKKEQKRRKRKKGELLPARARERAPFATLSGWSSLAKSHLKGHPAAM